MENTKGERETLSVKIVRFPEEVLISYDGMKLFVITSKSNLFLDSYIKIFHCVFESIIFGETELVLYHIFISLLNV